MSEEIKKFFIEENTRSAIKQVLEHLSSLPKSTSEFENFRNRFLTTILNSMRTSPTDWDKSCAINIQWFSSSFSSQLLNLPDNSAKESLDLLYATCFRFLIELDLSTKNSLVTDLEQAKTFTTKYIASFDRQAKDQIEFAWKDMPISMMKMLMNSEQIVTLKDFGETVDFALSQKTLWENDLTEREKRVLRLKENLDQYESGFNFVGLHQGFEEMATIKNNEKNNIKFWLRFFGILITLPFIFEAIVIWNHLDRIDTLRTALLISIVPTISLAGVLIFYFRVLLHNFNATKSQILQIELRKTLCRFIQSYVVYAEKMGEKNQNSLSRFEGIIFSGLVSSDDKLPSTFDGLEQIGNILKSMKK